MTDQVTARPSPTVVVLLVCAAVSVLLAVVVAPLMGGSFTGVAVPAVAAGWMLLEARRVHRSRTDGTRV